MTSRENLQLITVADRLRQTKKWPETEAEDEKFADSVGYELAIALRLHKDPEHKDRWQTGWGTKTNAGLARTNLRILEEA